VKKRGQWSVNSEPLGSRDCKCPPQTYLSRIVVISATFLLALVPTLAPAQQSKPWEKIPIPPLHDFKPQQPKRIELKNGIVLFLQEDHELPFVSGSVLIPGGSRDEDASKCGMIGLYGQTWRTSGTAKLSGDAMDDLLESKAAHIETSGDVDSTVVSWDSLKADTNQVYDLAMDLLFHPKFDEQKLQLAKQQEATGIVRRNDDEAQIAGREAAKLIYGADSPYARTPELSTIAKVTLSDLQAWHDRSIGGKLIVSVSGDFDSAAIEARLRTTFEGLPQARPNPVRHETFRDPTPGVYFIDKEDVNQSAAVIVGLGIERRNPDVPSVAMMNDIFAGGFASRLFQKVRTELGLAYGVEGGLGFDWDHPAGFEAVAQTQSATTVEAIQQTYKVLEGLTTQSFTEEELKRAKDNILNSFLFRYDTKDKVLAERVRLEFYGYPANYLETYKAALERVTVADLNAAAKKYIHPGKYALLVVGNGPEIKPGLDELKMGPIHKIEITIPGAPDSKGSRAEGQQ